MRFRDTEPEFIRYFQTVHINELSFDDTVEVLRAHRGLFEKHHRVTITDEAISEAVRLSAQYMPEQVLPARALDLMDEAAAMLWNFLPIGERQQQAQELVLTAQHIADLIALRQ
jgi:ATP-dependent Clp protease ATP-binding subunit ClpC